MFTNAQEQSSYYIILVPESNDFSAGEPAIPYISEGNVK